MQETSLHVTHYTRCPHEKVLLNFHCNFYKYRWIFIIFVHNFTRKCQTTRCKNFLPHIRFVATVLRKNFRHKNNTFHAILALCTMHRFTSMITFTETSLDKTIKTHQKVIGSKYMFKMSTTHRNTRTQMTTPLRFPCRNDGVVQQPSLPQQTFFQLLHIIDKRMVNLLLKDTPDDI